MNSWLILRESGQAYDLLVLDFGDQVFAQVRGLDADDAVDVFEADKHVLFK